MGKMLGTLKDNGSTSARKRMGPPDAFSIKVAVALDSLVDGRGFGKKEQKVMALCDAAPEMYEALKYAEKHGIGPNFGALCKAALAKAEGRT